MNLHEQELSTKLNRLRQTLTETGAAGIRLRGTDWFAWATAGAMHTVLLTAETGIAEVLVTPQGAWILTDAIEVQRLKDEEIFGSFEFAVNPWAAADQREAFVREATQSGPILSDRPTRAESPLPSALIEHKRALLPTELDRYRQVGQLASAAMTEVLTQAQPDWTEYQLAGAGAAALWIRGLHPALTLVAGERRLPLYRHATPTQERIGRMAMLVFCARGFGLYANLTRFVYFEQPSNAETDLHRQVREVEAVALHHSQIGTPLNQIYTALQQAYEQQGYPNAIDEHHQGGTTGYLAREVVANPNTTECLLENTAIAWNPSLAGAKVEDTFVLNRDGHLENLTLDPTWPVVEVAGRFRPLPLIHA